MNCHHFFHLLFTVLQKKCLNSFTLQWLNINHRTNFWIFHYFFNLPSLIIHSKNHIMFIIFLFSMLFIIKNLNISLNEIKILLKLFEKFHPLPLFFRNFINWLLRDIIFRFRALFMLNNLHNFGNFNNFVEKLRQKNISGKHYNWKTFVLFFQLVYPDKFI